MTTSAKQLMHGMITRHDPFADSSFPSSMRMFTARATANAAIQSTSSTHVPMTLATEKRRRELSDSALVVKTMKAL